MVKLNKLNELYQKHIREVFYIEVAVPIKCIYLKDLNHILKDIVRMVYI